MDFVKYDCTPIRKNQKQRCAKLSELKIEKSLLRALIEIYGNFELYPPQQEAIFEKNLLFSRKNFLIASPTNSGKTLLAILKLFSAALEGKRGIYIVPYKAISLEKKAEFDMIKEKLSKKIYVVLTTGDRKNDLFDYSPPDSGEIIITTPERFDSIMRSPNFKSWIDKVSTIVLDEIHHIDDEKRGPVIECIIARLISLSNYPQLICISATIRNLDEISNWLKPCSVVTSTYRPSHLRMHIYIPKEDAKKEVCLCKIADEILNKKGKILIFTSTRKRAEKYAKALNQKHKVAYFHAGLSVCQRCRIRKDFEKGKIKAIIATSTLSEGVNLPATHVLVADTTYWDEKMKKLSIRTLIQMMGRAGRKTGGTAILLLDRKTDEQTVNYYIKNIKEGNIEPIKSRIFPHNAKQELLVQLVIKERVDLKHFEENFCYLLNNKKISFKNILEDFVDSSLAIFDGKYYLPTPLGKIISRTYIPIETGIGFAQLIEDLRELKAKGKIDLSSLEEIDILFAVCAKNEEKLRIYNLEKYETLTCGKKSTFLSWLGGTTGKEMSARLLESLNINPKEYKDAKRYARRIMLTSLAIDAYLKGERLSMICKDFLFEIGELESYLSSLPYLINAFGKIAWLLGEREISQKCANMLESFP